jgi:hypothetical protein
MKKLEVEMNKAKTKNKEAGDEEVVYQGLRVEK